MPIDFGSFLFFSSIVEMDRERLNFRRYMYKVSGVFIACRFTAVGTFFFALGRTDEIFAKADRT